MTEELGFLPHWPGVAEATNCDAFDEDVLDSSVPVLVEFWAARCGSCRRLAPVLDALAREQRGTLRVLTLNVDEELPAAVRFGVMAIPALLFFREGEEQGRLVGLPTDDELRAFLEFNDLSATG